MSIPDAAIEAAAEAGFKAQWGALYSWERVPELEAEAYRKRARAVISAAMPAICEAIEAEDKRHRGAPLASGEGNVRIIRVRVTEKWFRKIDRWRKRRNLSVSAAGRQLIESGLAFDGEPEPTSREAIAKEIEAKHRYPNRPLSELDAYWDGINTALRIVRGGTP